MHLNKRGVALLQVLIVAAVLAGFSAMVLRVVMSRTLLARQNRRTVTAQMLIENCMAEVNYKLASQTPSARNSEIQTDTNLFAEKALPQCCIPQEDLCPNKYTCAPTNGVTVKATFLQVSDQATGDKHCEITYTIEDEDADNL